MASTRLLTGALDCYVESLVYQYRRGNVRHVFRASLLPQHRTSVNVTVFRGKSTILKGFCHVYGLYVIRHGRYYRGFHGAHQVVLLFGLLTVWGHPAVRVRGSYKVHVDYQSL